MTRASRTRSARMLVILAAVVLLGTLQAHGATSGAQLGSSAQEPVKAVSAAAYDAVGDTEAAPQVVVPVFRSNHTTWQLVTGVAVMNVGDGTTVVELTAIDALGNVTAGLPGMTKSVEPHESAYFWPPDFLDQGAWADPARAYGSAIITSREPVLVTVHDISQSDMIDTVMFRGAGVHGDDSADDRRAHVPLIPAESSREGPRPGGVSGVLVTNLDTTRTAAMTMIAWPYDGRSPISNAAAETLPQKSAVFYMPGLGEQPYGLYSAVFSSDRSISALVRTDWHTEGAAASHDATSLGSEVAVPAVFLEHEGRCSSLAVQNAGETGTTAITIELRSHGDPGTAHQIASFDLEASRGRKVSLCDEPELADVKRPFVGSALVVPSAAPVAVTTNVTVSGQKAESGYEGISLEAAGRRQYAPLVHSAYANAPRAGESSSTIAVRNLGATPAQLHVEYRGAHGSCVDEEYHAGPFSLDAQDGRLIPVSGAAGGALPAGCLASAVVWADADIAAAVLDEMRPAPPSSTRHTVHMPRGLKRYPLE